MKSNLVQKMLSNRYLILMSSLSDNQVNRSLYWIQIHLRKPQISRISVTWSLKSSWVALTLTAFKGDLTESHMDQDLVPRVDGNTLDYVVSWFVSLVNNAWLFIDQVVFFLPSHEIYWIQFCNVIGWQFDLAASN